MTVIIGKATAEELLAELRDANNPQGITSSEMAAMWDCSTKLALLRLKRLIDAGKMKYAGRRRTVRIDGTACSVPVYAVVKHKRNGA